MENDSNTEAEPTPNADYKPFTLKKWNGLAMWSWDVICDVCAICRLQLTEDCLRCQGAEPVVSDDNTGAATCVVVWGECSHSFHNCCMSQWVRQNNRCPLCQADWSVARIGK